MPCKQRNFTRTVNESVTISGQEASPGVTSLQKVRSNLQIHVIILKQPNRNFSPGSQRYISSVQFKMGQDPFIGLDRGERLRIGEVLVRVWSEIYHSSFKSVIISSSPCRCREDECAYIPSCPPWRLPDQSQPFHYGSVEGCLNRPRSLVLSAVRLLPASTKREKRTRTRNTSGKTSWYHRKPPPNPYFFSAGFP